MMIELNSQNALCSMEKQFYNIFKGKNPFGEMFNDWVEDRLIICPVTSYHLDDEQLHALIRAVELSEEAVFNISEVEFDEPFIIVEPEYIQPRHWKCTLPNIYEEYNNTYFCQETAIYSTSGKWGLIISHEDHAVIGGSRLFMNAFKYYYPKWSMGYDNFIKMWDKNKKLYNSNLDWMNRFLKHVNG